MAYEQKKLEELLNEKCSWEGMIAKANDTFGDPSKGIPAGVYDLKTRKDLAKRLTAVRNADGSVISVNGNAYNSLPPQVYLNEVNTKGKEKLQEASEKVGTFVKDNYHGLVDALSDKGMLSAALSNDKEFLVREAIFKQGDLDKMAALLAESGLYSKDYLMYARAAEPELLKQAFRLYKDAEVDKKEYELSDKRETTDGEGNKQVAVTGLNRDKIKEYLNTVYEGLEDKGRLYDFVAEVVNVEYRAEQKAAQES